MKLAQQVKLLLALVVILSALPAGARTQRRSAPAVPRLKDDVERRVNALLARMTLKPRSDRGHPGIRHFCICARSLAARSASSFWSVCCSCVAEARSPTAR